MKDLNSRQEELKQLILDDAKPTVHNMTSGEDCLFTCGDLQAIGWMSKRYTHDSGGEIDGWERTYFGPNSFFLHTMGAEALEEIHAGVTF